MSQSWQPLIHSQLTDQSALHLIIWEYPAPAHFSFPWQEWLDATEKQRAEGIPHAIRRFQFLIARSVLRWTVAQRLNQAPAQLQFGYDAKSKPFLQGNNQQFFNLSHSGDQGLLALWSGGEVGVDIEQYNPHISFQVLRRIAHPEECAAILASEQPDRDQAGLRLWVRKEAIAKVQGQGIFRARQFPCLPLDLLFRDCFQPCALVHCHLMDIPGLARAAAAVAWEGEVKKIYLWQLSLDQLG